MRTSPWLEGELGAELPEGKDRRGDDGGRAPRNEGGEVLQGAHVGWRGGVRRGIKGREGGNGGFKVGGHIAVTVSKQFSPAA